MKLPRISLAGSGGVLLDAGDGPFSDETQRRVWAVGRAALDLAGVSESVPGMNNLLIVFDPQELSLASLTENLLQLWGEVEAKGLDSTAHRIPVRYGGPQGEDLQGWARHCALSVDDIVKRHSAGRYIVATVGAMPGFPYLSGLDPALEWGRRSTPRLAVREGAVIVGGAQTGIMPMTAPSGWHVIGHTDVKLFDIEAKDPVLLRPGDEIRFEIADVLA